MILFDFLDSSIPPLFRSVNDSVMGGLSEGQMTHDREIGGIFNGRVSFERNGGFASVRNDFPPLDVSRFTGLSLNVRGDGKTYKLNLRDDGQFDGIQFQVRFRALESWSFVTVPFTQFSPVIRGRPVSRARVINLHTITSLGFLISDRQEGPFRLEIARISGVEM
jgi:monofunctional biosynthetic peptidoglycan transglycosylase